MRSIVGIMMLTSILFADDHTLSKQSDTSKPRATALSQGQTLMEDFNREYESARKDKGGCLWREEDWKKAEGDSEYGKLMDRICEAENIAMDLANKDRKRFCKNPLILDQRLAYVSRLNSLRVIKEGGVRHPNPHNGWYAGQPQKWFQDFFPAAAKVIKFERENMWGMGGGDAQKINAGTLANQATTSWIHSPGHHAPMIDCNNRYAGVGFMYAPKRNEWLGFMSFGELATSKIPF